MCHFSFPQISGGAVEYTFTDLDLHDGSQYTVGVMACNGASVCTGYHTYTFKVTSNLGTSSKETFKSA